MTAIGETGETQAQDRASIFAMVRDHLTAELEDTYGIAMSEDEAAKIETVGAAVDFVFARLPGD